MRNAWRKYAVLAAVLILVIAGAILIPLWWKSANITLPGFASATPRIAETTLQSAPSPEQAARTYLDAWQTADYPGMYSLLTAGSRGEKTEEEFSAYYANVSVQTALRSLEYKILTVEMTPTDARVGFEVTLHSIVFGDITEQPRILFKKEDSKWKVAWDGQTILPELENGNALVFHREYPVRGSIYDRNGLTLASEAEEVDLGIVPGEITDEEAVLAALSTALHMPREMIRQMYSNAAPEDYVPIGDVDKAEIENRLAALGQLGGVYLNTFSTRYYYGGGVASHVVGYLRKISPEMLAAYQSLAYAGSESVGAAGLEQSTEQDLAGKQGGSLLISSADGATVLVLARSEPQAAMDVYTTLDRDLQTQIERTVMGTYNGAAVVLNRNTGEVLAMISSKHYDSNLFSVESYNGSYLLEDLLADPASPLTNRAAIGAYPLGSVFKIITMAAGLESGLVIPTSVYNDGDGYYYGCDGFVGTDWTIEKDMKPHGEITLEQCLMRSCNPCFWHLGEELFYQEPWRVPNMAKAFGLGSKTGIPGVEESAGLVPDPTWKADTEGVTWACGDALNQAIGQGKLQVTPLQVADFTAAIGNGGILYRPQILLSIRPEDGEPIQTFAPIARGQLPIQTQNLLAIQRAMRSVVNDPKGTAWARFYGLRDIVKIAGKTGTAESGAENPHAWFVAYTLNEAPNKPDIAVAVIAEYAGEGSVYAARMARRIIEIYFLGRPSALYPWESEYGLRGTDTPTITEESAVTEEPTFTEVL